jgi:hypothetical protein
MLLRGACLTFSAGLHLMPSHQQKMAWLSFHKSFFALLHAMAFVSIRRVDGHLDVCFGAWVVSEHSMFIRGSATTHLSERYVEVPPPVRSAALKSHILTGT